MKAELVKRQDRWDLYGEDGSKIASSAPNPMNKLSLNNCQAIANGYDLEELATEKLSTRFNETDGYHKFVFVEAYKEGFQKAVEILGDKKFTKNDILIAMICMQGQEVFYEKTFEETQETRKLYIDNYIQSLQQTEWDVSVEIEQLATFTSMPKEGEKRLSEKPKLDGNGCLILKRI
jgi:hypothetical protein